jgi:twinkle protein
MGVIVTKNQPCHKCNSSDARQIYEDGSSFCFSCRSFFKSENYTEDPVSEVSNKITLEEISKLPSRGFRTRHIRQEVCDFFGVKVSYNQDGEIDTHYYPYDGGKAYKVRKLPKEFYWVGKSKSLFGKDKFSGGGAKIIITEGEIDALSVGMAQYMRYKQVYPVVAISSASMTSVLLEERDWLRSFKEVVLAFDNDDAGKKATEEAIRIIGFDKVKITKFEDKDLNLVLTTKGHEKLMQILHTAETYTPAGIIGYTELWENLVNYNSLQSIPYPPCLEGLNTKLKGMRYNEIALFVSGTGAGKSTMLREIILHLLQNTDEKIGIVSLEESPAETARKLSGMALLKNPAKEEIPLDELKIGFDSVFANEKIVLVDHQGAITDLSIMDRLEYMCLSGCKFLFIDHITILVSEGVDNLQGNEAQDKIMNALLKLVKRYDVWIGLVSHLRKKAGGTKSFEEGVLPNLDDIRGSGSIKQISFDIIAFARNMSAPTDELRNSIKMAVLKSRYTGLTGKVNGARYNYDTGRLHYSETIDSDDFEIIEV